MQTTARRKKATMLKIAGLWVARFTVFAQRVNSSLTLLWGTRNKIMYLFAAENAGFKLLLQ